MPNKFIPVNDVQAQSLSESLSKTIFKSPESFVELYNSEIINKKNDQVRSVLVQITEVFKNVKEQGAELIFLSEAEIALRELTEAFRVWGVLSSAKRVAVNAVERGELDESDSVAFSKKNSGALLKVVIDDGDEIVLSKLSAEKLYNKFDEIEEIFETGKLTGERDGDTFILPATSLINLDESFLIDAHQLVG